MFRLKFKGIHSFVSDRKTNYCHLMQCWHWNTQDGICWFGVKEGLMQLPPSQPVAPFLSAACRDEVFSSFGCYLPSQWVTGSFCADSYEFQNLDLNIDWKKWGLSGKLKHYLSFSPWQVPPDYDISFEAGLSIFLHIGGNLGPLFSIIACFGQLS